MNPAAELLYGHDVLRGKLVSLESFLSCLDVAPFTVSRLTESLATCLRAHIEREEHLLDMVMRQQDEPPFTLIQQLCDEHENHRTRLAILHELLAEGTPRSEEQIMTQAGDLIKDLREHMAKEEEQLFPFMDQERREREECAAAAVDDEAAQLLGLA